MNQKWKDIIGTVAPGLATALGGPLAGMAVSAIGQAVLGKTGASEDDVASAIIAASPSDLLKLKEAEMQFQKDMAQLDVDLEKIAGEDRASARAMQTTNKDWIPGALAILVTVMFFADLAFMATHEVHDNATLNQLTGSLGTVWITIISFYFGSTSTSHVKDATISKLTK